MGITRAQIARQLLAEGGVSLNDAKMMAPEGEFLAYINPKEAGILKALGGSGRMTPMGIPSFTEDEEDQRAMNAPDYSSQDLEEQAAIDAGEPTAQMSTMSRDLQGFGPRTNINDLSSPNFFQTVGDVYNRLSPVANIGRGLNFVKRGIGSLFDKFGAFAQNMRGGLTQREFEQARRDRINQNRISNILGRDAPFTAMTLNNLRNLGYTGSLGPELLGTTNAMRTINDPTFGPVIKGTIFDAEEPEGIQLLAPDYRFTDAMREINLRRGTTGRNEGQLVAGLNIAEKQAYDTLKGIVDAVGSDMLNDKQKQQLQELEKKKNESNLGLGTFIV